MQEKAPKLIKGGKYIDNRGRLDFVNNFDMTLIKRVYFTTHFNTNVVRAWQAHKQESRWFMCVGGSFKVKLVEIDDWKTPSTDLKVYEYTLSANEAMVLHIPYGFANGFKALEENSKLMIFSNYKLGEIEDDQVRFDSKFWANWDN